MRSEVNNFKDVDVWVVIRGEARYYPKNMLLSGGMFNQNQVDIKYYWTEIKRDDVEAR